MRMRYRRPLGHEKRTYYTDSRQPLVWTTPNLGRTLLGFLPLRDCTLDLREHHSPNFSVNHMQPVTSLSWGCTLRSFGKSTIHLGNG